LVAQSLLGCQLERFRATGGRVVTASGDNTARIWDARTDEPIGKPLQHQAPVNAASFDATGGWVVTASRDNTARIWKPATVPGQPYWIGFDRCWDPEHRNP
jgi:WD40 repeat protein